MGADAAGHLARPDAGEVDRHPLPGIALSGFVADADRHRSLASGFAHHLGKPVDVAKLVQAIGSTAATNVANATNATNVATTTTKSAATATATAAAAPVAV